MSKQGLDECLINLLSVNANVDVNNLLFTLDITKLIYKTQPGVYDLQRPLITPADFDWNSVYGLYKQGKELFNERKYDAAEVKLKLAIDKDHNFIPSFVPIRIMQKCRNGKS